MDFPSSHEVSEEDPQAIPLADLSVGLKHGFFHLLEPFLENVT
jgi:hypothetical protein